MPDDDGVLPRPEAIHKYNIDFVSSAHSCHLQEKTFKYTLSYNSEEWLKMQLHNYISPKQSP